VFPEILQGLFRLEHSERAQPLIDQDHVVLSEEAELPGRFRYHPGGNLVTAAPGKALLLGGGISRRRKDPLDKVIIEPDNCGESCDVLDDLAQLPDPLGKGEGDWCVRLRQREGGKLLAVFGAVYEAQPGKKLGLPLTGIEMAPASFFGFATERTLSSTERAFRCRRFCLFEIHQHLAGGRIGDNPLYLPRGNELQQILIEFLDFHGSILQNAKGVVSTSALLSPRVAFIRGVTPRPDKTGFLLDRSS